MEKGRSKKENRHFVSNNQGTGLSIRKQCAILHVSRSHLYYKPTGEKKENLEIMQLMDSHNLEHPDEGVRGMQNMLTNNSLQVNHKRIRRLMNLMDIKAIYPRKNLTVIAKGEYKYPYLLRGIEIDKPNQVWSIDITYIAMNKGFMYLTAIIDVYSRFIVGWSLSNSLDAEVSLNVLKDAIKKHGKPEIINSDQGCQYTSKLWTGYLNSPEIAIKISMDGRGRATDNIWIERFWRTIKRGYVYLNPANDGLELYRGIKKYITYYNYNRRHSSLKKKTPSTVYTDKKQEDVPNVIPVNKYAEKKKNTQLIEIN